MNTSRTLSIATLSLLALCVASPAFAQSTNVKKRKTATIKRPNSQVRTTSTSKTPIQRGETHEQRLRRLKNDGYRDRCIEALEEATGAKVRYDEGACRLGFVKPGNGLSFSFSLTSVNVSVVGRQFTVTCRSGQCLANNRGTDASGSGNANQHGYQLKQTPSMNLAKCIEDLKNRCKK